MADTIEHSLDLTDPKILAYQMAQIQATMVTMTTSIAGISAQLTSLQLALPDRYLTRIEFAEILRQKELQQQATLRRLDQFENKEAMQDSALHDLEVRWDSRGWGIAGSILMGGIALLGVGATVVFNIITLMHGGKVP